MQTQVNDITLIVNNDRIAHEANSVKWTEGLGEQSVRANPAGEGRTEKVYSSDLSTNVPKVMFDLAGTDLNIARAKKWKLNGPNNTVQVIVKGGNTIRVFTGAALVSDYEVEASSDGVVSLEFHCAEVM